MVYQYLSSTYPLLINTFYTYIDPCCSGIYPVDGDHLTHRCALGTGYI